MATKYNPYNAVKNITELKGKYHTAKEMGGNYDQYHTEALDWYDELNKNGYTDIADELASSDYTKSLDILGRYKPDTEFQIDSYYDDLVGNTAPKVEYTPKNEIDNSFIDKLFGIGAGNTKPQASDTVNSILDSFKETNEKLNGELRYDANGNVIGGLNVDHYNTGKNQLDFINNFDYTKQSYFDPIMDSYKLKGADASKGELASGASSNAGNIDSFAAANANRQQLAFTNAGHEAARAAAQQNQENWQALYNAMSGNLSDMGAINAQNLGTASEFYKTDSAERQNALNIGAELANQRATREFEQYLAELSDATKRHEIDSNTAATRAQQALEKYIAELSDNTDRYNIDANERVQNAANKAALDQILAEITGQKEINSENYANEIANLEKQYELAQKYGVSLDNDEVDEQETIKSMYRDINSIIDIMNNNEDDNVKTYSDVYNAMIELYPQYETEIRAYINFVKNNSGTANGVVHDDFISPFIK